MNYIIYNSLAIAQKNNRGVKKLYKKLTKNDVNSTYLLALNEIEGKETSFVNQLSSDDVIYFCGGDLDLDSFINKISEANPKCKIYYYTYKANSDFAKAYKGKLLIDISDQSKWPKLIINGVEKYSFINCCGMGYDAAVCRSKIQYAMSGNKKGYFSITYNIIKSYRFFSIDGVIDGKEVHYDDIWFFSFNNGKYFGDGMKVAPKEDIEADDLSFVIVHGASKLKILLIFPLVYFGLHTKFKKYVDVIKCKKAHIKPDGCMLLQRDGLALDYVMEIDVSR